MKYLCLIVVMILNTSCDFFDCKNLNDENIIGKYKTKSSGKFLSLFKNKKYEYRDNNKKFEGEWLISSKKNCEICLKNWKSDSTVIDFMYVVMGKNELIFNYDNPLSNFSKMQ